MNKKIIALIITIPLILMVIILGATKGVSRQIDMPVSGIQLEKQVQSYTRFIDNWQDLTVKAAATPYNAKNKGVTYECVLDETTEDPTGEKATFAKNKIKIDSVTGNVAINADNNHDYSGKYKIIIQTNDGGYRVQVDLILKYYYAQKLYFEDVFRDNESIDYGPNGVIQITPGTRFVAKATLSPTNIYHQNIRCYVEDPEIVKIDNISVHGHYNEIVCLGQDFGETYVIAEYYKDDQNTQLLYQERFKVEVVDDLKVKEVEKMELVNSRPYLNLMNDIKLNANLNLNQIRVKVTYTNTQYATEEFYLSQLIVKNEAGEVVNDHLDTMLPGQHRFSVTYLDYETDFSYYVAPKIIKNLSFSGKLVGTAFYNDETEQMELSLQVKKDEVIKYQDVYVHLTYENLYEDEDYVLSYEQLIDLSGNALTTTGFKTDELGQISFGLKDLAKVVIKLEIMQASIVDLELVEYLPYYHQGASFDYQHPKLKVFYSYSEYNQIVDLDPLMVIGFDTTTIGSHSFRINYLGFHKTFNYFVDEQTVDELWMTSDYYSNVSLGSTIYPDRIRLFAKKSSGMVETITLDDTKIIDGDLSTTEIGPHEITVRYGGMNYTLTYFVYANPKVIENLSIEGKTKFLIKTDPQEVKKQLFLRIHYTDEIYPDELINLADAELNVQGLITEYVGTIGIMITYQKKDATADLTFVESSAKMLYLDAAFNPCFMQNAIVDLTTCYVWLKHDNEMFSRHALADLTDLSIDTTNEGEHAFNFTFEEEDYQINYQVVGNSAKIRNRQIETINEVSQLSKQYLIGQIVDYESLMLLVSFVDDRDNDVILTDIKQTMISGELGASLAGEYQFSIQYLDANFDFAFEVLAKNVDTVEIIGLEKRYVINSVVDISNIYIRYTYQNGYHSEMIKLQADLLDPTYEAIIENNLLVTKNLGHYEFKIKDFREVFSYEVTYRIVKSIAISSGLDLNKGVFVGDLLDINKIFVKITFEDTPNVADIIPLSNSDFQVTIPNTTQSGEVTLKLQYLGTPYDFKFNVNDIVVTTIVLEQPFALGYLRYQIINLDDYFVRIIYNNDTFERIPLSSSMIVGTFGTDTVDEKNFQIKYQDVLSATYSYKVLNAITKLENKVSWTQEFSYTITVSRAALASLGYTDYQLKYTFDQSKVNITKVELQNNGSFKVYGAFIRDQLGDTFELSYQLELAGVAFNTNYTTIVRHDYPDFKIAYASKVKLGTTSAISVTSDLTNVGLSYDWQSSNTNIISISGNKDSVAIIAKSSGSVTITITITLNDTAIKKEIEVEVIDTYDGIDFEIKPNGISEYVALGRDDYNHLLQNKVSSEHTFTMIDKDERVIPLNQLILYIVNPDTFALETVIPGIVSVADGKLLINKQLTTPKIITLKAITKGSLELGLTDESNYATIKLLVTPGLNVTDYESLKWATEHGEIIVLHNDIDVGDNLMTIVTNANGTTSREINIDIAPSGNYANDDEKKRAAYMEAKRILDSEVKLLPTTGDYSFYKNNGLAHPFVKYCLEFTNNVYGNGYTIDTKNITTVLDKYSYTPITYEGVEISPFRGPLNLVWFQGDSTVGASVKAQDNIAFLIRNNNILLDNVVLQACDDAFLYKENEGNVYVEINNLNYVGTTLEIMGDNVDIINSRIKNGRTVVRIYGAAHEDDPHKVSLVQPIDVTIESSIISMGREFLIKMGTNQYVEGVLPAGANKDTNPGWEAVSPLLKGQNGVTYYPSNQATYRYDDGTYTTNNDYNLNNDAFKAEFVKTNVTLRNIVLTNCGFFSIGMESQFAGPCLDGLQYGYNFYEEGWRDIAGTSYAAVLTLEGDVRIYDWKKLSSIDSSTLIDGDIFKFDVPALFNYLVNEVPGYEDLITQVGNTDDEIYVHGGIAMYGGGKNYHIINNQLNQSSQFPNRPYYVSLDDFASDAFISSGYVKSNFAALYKALPYASGRSSFKFYIYDRNEDSLTYEQQVIDLASSAAYNIIKAVTRAN